MPEDAGGVKTAWGRADGPAGVQTAACRRRRSRADSAGRHGGVDEARVGGVQDTWRSWRGVQTVRMACRRRSTVVLVLRGEGICDRDSHNSRCPLTDSKIRHATQLTQSRHVENKLKKNQDVHIYQFCARRVDYAWASHESSGCCRTCA